MRALCVHLQVHRQIVAQHLRPARCQAVDNQGHEPVVSQMRRPVLVGGTGLDAFGQFDRWQRMYIHFGPNVFRVFGEANKTEWPRDMARHHPIKAVHVVSAV